MIKKIAILGVIVLFTFLLIYCTTDESTIIGPFGDAGKYLSITSSIDKEKMYSNGDSSVVYIKILDVNNSPAIGLRVDFTAQFGNITEYDLTDSSGIASAVFISDGNTGENIITVDTGVKKYTFTINVVKYQPKYIELYSSSTLLLANGSEIATITAVFKDSTYNPMPDVMVNFETTLGDLSRQVGLTDVNGMVTTELASSEEGVATVTVVSGVMKSIEIKFQNNTPAFLELFSDQQSVFANGQDIATITAVVKDSTARPMSGVTIEFGTNLGDLKVAADTTDVNGVVITELTSDEEGVATVTATSYSISNSVNVDFNVYAPSVIEMSASQVSILADGLSTTTITTITKGSDDIPMPDINILFSTTEGVLSDSTKRTNQSGSAEITLTSTGSIGNIIANVKAIIGNDTSISEDIDIQLRGITNIINIDSTKMSDGGIYNAYVRANLFETLTGDVINSGTVTFSSTIGTMNDNIAIIDELGVARSVFNTEVLPTNQYDIIIESELSSASEIFSSSEEFDIPGAEMLINTIDDDVMGDGEGWALVKATLREISGRAIPNTNIEWGTTLGTIIGQSETNTSGHTIDTLRIENPVSQNTSVTIYAKYGDNISTSDVVTFVEPENSQRLILGFEPDTTGHGIIPCNIDTALATREVGISALFVNSDGNPKYDGKEINFSVVPNNFAYICPTDTTESGVANVMMIYPPQNGGEIVRVWGEAPDGTRGSIDVVLPKDVVTVE